MPAQVISARTINRMIHFACPDERTADLFRYLACAPQMPDPSDPLLRVTLVWTGGYHYLFDGPDGKCPGTARLMLNCALDLLSGQLLNDTASDVLLEAGSMLVNDRRLLVLSASAFARQGLMLQAYAAGSAIESDLHVVVRDQYILAVPSRMRIDARLAPMFPGLQQRILAAPRVVDWNGDIFHSFAPLAADGQWRISPGKVDALVVVEPNSGGCTSAGRVASDLVFRLMLERAHLGVSDRAHKLARLHLLSRAAPSWKIRWGTGDGVIRHLQGIARASSSLPSINPD